jgi:hypothetical protein
MLFKITLILITALIGTFCSQTVFHNPDSDTKKNSDQELRLKSSGSQYAQGEVIIRFRETLSEEQILSVLNKNRLSIIHQFKLPKLFLLKIEDQDNVDKKIAILKALDEVTYVEPNYRISIESEIKKKEHRTGEILVRFKQDVNRDEIEALLKKLDIKILQSYSIPNLYLLQLPEGQSVDGIVAELQAHPQILYAEPNFIYSIQSKPK